jgi:hypothetical protein
VLRAYQPGGLNLSVPAQILRVGIICERAARFFFFLTSSVVADRLVLSSQRFNIDGQAVESYMLVRPAMLAHILPALADQKFGLSNLTGRGFVACLDFWDPTRPAMPAPHFTISVPNGWAVSGINGSICEPLVLFGACMLEAWPDKLNL